VQSRESGVLHPAQSRGTPVARPIGGGFAMLMFKRSQLYLALGLAALAEIIIVAMVR
jgi:hypothetical protein